MNGKPTNLVVQERQGASKAHIDIYIHTRLCDQPELGLISNPLAPSQGWHTGSVDTAM